jgi:hypothetical protein
MTNHWNAYAGIPYVVQSVLLSRDKFKTLDEAKEWLVSHGYKYVLPDTTPSFYRFRQREPQRLALTHRLRTVKMGDAGSLIVAYPRR